MKSKCTIICLILIILFFSNFSAFPRSPDTSNYEKDYHRFVDSKEPLKGLKNKDSQLYQSYVRTILSHRLTPSKTIKILTFILIREGNLPRLSSLFTAAMKTRFKFSTLSALGYLLGIPLCPLIIVPYLKTNFWSR